MTAQYAIKFSHGHKEYCLIAIVEGQGVQPRFKLAVNDGSFSWTADSESCTSLSPALAILLSRPQRRLQSFCRRERKT